METTEIQNQTVANLNRFFKQLMMSYLETHEKELSAEMLVHLMQINLGFCQLNEFAMSCLANAVGFAQQFINCPNEIQPALQCLVKLLAPQRIYLFKHQNTYADSHYGYDVYIIIPERPGRKLVHLQPYLDLAGLSAIPITCSLFTWAKVKDGFNKGQLFFLLNFNQRHLVYDDGSLSIPNLGFSEHLLAKEQMHRLFAPNFKLANAFLQGAFSESKREELCLAVFMLHQATEFTYRAFLLSFCGTDQKTHSIAVFQNHLKRLTPTLNAVFNLDIPEDKRLFDLLEDAYLHARYEPSFKVSASDFELLYAKVQQILREAERVLAYYQSVLDIAE